MIKLRWPFMLKSTHRTVQAENYVLRDALKQANEELRKHRLLIAGLRDGHRDTADKLMKVFQK